MTYQTTYIHTYTPNTKLTIYADDTAITFTENNNTLLRNDINKTLLKIEKWFQYNKLKLNITKTEIINFNSSKYPDNIIIFNKNIIKNTDEYKYLGITIDNKLKFHKYTLNINKKISKMLYSINKLSTLLKTKTLITIYNNICLPHLTYGNYIWGNTYNNNIKAIQLIHKKIIRIINNKKYQEHTENLFISNNYYQ